MYPQKKHKCFNLLTTHFISYSSAKMFCEVRVKNVCSLIIKKMLLKSRLLRKLQKFISMEYVVFFNPQKKHDTKHKTKGLNMLLRQDGCTNNISSAFFNMCKHCDTSFKKEDNCFHWLERFFDVFCKD